MPPAKTPAGAAGAPTAREEQAGPRPLLLILDSHGIIYRSYFALRDALTLRRTGEPVGAVYGFANSLLYALDTLHPEYIVAAWDGPTPTFRHDADERYKATRRPMPDDLRPQIARVRALLDAFRIPVVEVPGFEADDVVGALATQAAAQGVDVVILTLDNDMVQLIDGPVRVQMYRPYQRDYVMYDAEAVRARWGFDPAQIVDYKALVGDASDNIPGVKGIGEKGALALIQQWGSVEAMLEHVAEVTPPRARTALEAGREDALHSKTMATIIREVPGVTLDLEACVVGDYDRDAVLAMFRDLEFRSLVSRLPDHVTDSPGPRGPAVAAPSEERRYEVVTTAERLAAVVREIRRAGRFAHEVVADDPHLMRAADCLVGIGLSIAATRGWYVPFGHTSEPLPPAEGQQELALESAAAASEEAARASIPQLTQEGALAVLGPLFADATVERVAHDAKFATLALAEAKGGVWPAPVAFDTMVAAYLLGDSNVTVRGLAFNRLGQELVDPKLLLGTGRKAIPFSRTTPEDCAAFAAGNADLALRLADVLRPDLEANALLGVFEDIDLPHIPVLARMERWGLALDPQALREQAGVLATAIEEAEREVFSAVGHEFQIGSPQQLSAVLFSELGLPKSRKTATGYTTDATALEPLRGVHPAVDAVLRWREVTKIKSTYVDTLPEQINPRTGRIHSVFSQVTAATGRLSSSDPNLQNIPLRTEIGNAVRRAFVARDCGESPIFLSFDYSQIELRVLAHMCGDDELRSAFERGLDIHAATSARVFGVPLTEVTPEMRRRAKVFNFGVLYGLTQPEGIPRDEAEQFIKHYFDAYPTVADWRDRVVDEARAKGYAATLTGRRRYIPELRASNRNQRMAAERIAINMPIQGTAADIIKIAMNRIDAELLQRQARGALARMVLQVHDELIFELPAAEADDVREIAHRLMPSLELAVPLVIEEKSGHSWGDIA